MPSKLVIRHCRGQRPGSGAPSRRPLVRSSVSRDTAVGSVLGAMLPANSRSLVGIPLEGVDTLPTCPQCVSTPRPCSTAHPFSLDENQNCCSIWILPTCRPAQVAIRRLHCAMVSHNCYPFSLDENQTASSWMLKACHQGLTALPNSPTDLQTMRPTNKNLSSQSSGSGSSTAG